MKNKILLIIQIALLYIANLSFWGCLIFCDIENETLISTITTICLALCGVAFIVSIFYVAYSIVKPDKDVYLYAIVSKSLITLWLVFDWIVLNSVSFSASEHFWEFIYLLLSIIIEFGFYYIFVIMTSLPSMARSIKQLKDSGTKVSFGFGLTIISMFLPVFDILGSVLLYKKFCKRSENDD